MSMTERMIERSEKYIRVLEEKIERERKKISKLKMREVDIK